MSTELTMFERLLQLPLFQGLTNLEISELMSHVRLDFVNYQAGDEIVGQDEPCKQLYCIINGDVMAEYRDPQGRFVLREKLKNLGIIEPFNMFGMYQKFSRTYLFDSDGITLAIDKQQFFRQFLARDIVRMNMLNISCNKFQQTQKLLCHGADNTIAEKIAKFIKANSITDKGHKSIDINMKVLADIVHETRLNVSKTLNDLQNKDIITLNRGGFIIPEVQSII
ncbi:MAG: Crp/Fnr family transcriptional regulator [Prevotellaceae bacterium]|nr:Crp/Fnr family transcriptional regulator [Candidatus Minthosoma equi]